jgi:hypothetical protein
MSEISDDTRQHYLLSTRIPIPLRDQMEREAMALHVSLSDIVRLRLASGSIAVAADKVRTK